MNLNDEKVCPRCAETVKARATACRFCGHEFIEQAAPPADDAPAPSTVKDSSKKSVLPGCLGIFLVLGLISAVSRCGEDSNSNSNNSATPIIAEKEEANPERATTRPPRQEAAPQPQPRQITVVSAPQLAAAYEANEAAAQQQYGKRLLEVSGTVAGVDLDMFNNPIVLLVGTNEYLNVQATLAKVSRPRASSLGKGETVRLQCSDVGEVMGVPMLEDCTLM